MSDEVNEMAIKPDEPIEDPDKKLLQEALDKIIKDKPPKGTEWEDPKNSVLELDHPTMRTYLRRPARSATKTPIPKELVMGDAVRAYRELDAIKVFEDSKPELNFSDEIQTLINDELGDLPEVADSVARKFKIKLQQEVVLRLLDRANAIGNAYIVKEVLAEKDRYMYLLRCHANGYSYFENVLNRKTGEVIKLKTKVPSNLNAVIKALSYIDGTKSIATTKQTGKAERKKGIDEIINETKVS